MSRFSPLVLRDLRQKKYDFSSYVTKIVVFFHIMSLPYCALARNSNGGQEVNLHSFSKKQQGSSFAKFFALFVVAPVVHLRNR